jgi:hypothetical protein
MKASQFSITYCSYGDHNLSDVELISEIDFKFVTVLASDRISNFVLYLGKTSEQQRFANAYVIGACVATIVERRVWARCDGRYESNVA